jgi:predicted RNase H-like nuclease (RuvC/YqgF family)
MSDFKLQYFRQRVGDLVSSYENRIADLLVHVEELKAENARLRTEIEEQNNVVQEEIWTDDNPREN